MIRLNRSLLRDERGASLVELALLLPVLSTVVIGVADVSRAYSQKLQLEQAAYRAIEKVQQYQSTSSTVDTLKTEAANAAGITQTSTNPNITYTLYCDGAAQANYNTTCSTGQVYQRYVTVDITSTFTPMFASNKWPGSNSDGTYTLHGRASLRTQ